MPIGRGPQAGSVLEVRLEWGSVVLDSRLFGPNDGPVRIGDGVTHRWRFLGVEMGPVSEPTRIALGAIAGLWSEFDTAPRHAFRVPDVDDGWLLVERGDDGGINVRPPPGWTGEDGPLRDGDERTVSNGDLRLVCRAGPRPDRIDHRVSDDVDRPFVGLLGAVGAVFALVLGLSTAVHGPNHEVTLREGAEDGTVMLLAKVPTRPDPGDRKDARGGSSSAPAPADRPSRTKVRVGRTDRQVANRSGALIALADPDLAGVFGEGGLDPALIAGIGGLSGERYGEPGDGP
ncbi:MAG: hypothetical protein ABMB14_01370, partial [Myxococcota bacterium]